MVAYEGITISGAVPNPSTMNTWLKAKKEFKGDLLFYKAAEDLGFTYEGIVTATADIKNAMNEGKYAHLHVENGRHWVLATGLISGGYSVMDPGNVTYTYKYKDVVGCAVYSFPSSGTRKLNEQTEQPESESASTSANPNPSTESVATASQNQTDSPSSSPAPASAHASPISPSASHSEHSRSRHSSERCNLRKRSAK